MSIAAENVLGGVLIGGREAYWRVADVIGAADFANPQHSRLFGLIAEIAAGESDLDAVTVGDEAERRGIMPSWQVIDLLSQTISFANVRGHAERVKADALDRRFRAICAEGQRSGEITETQAAISELIQSRPGGLVPISQAMRSMWDGVMERYHSGRAHSGLQTGYADLDRMTGGLQPARVYGIGGRAKMGKSVLAMNIAANIACPPLDREGLALFPPRQVAVWSLEMAQDELAQRMACAKAGVRSALLQSPRLMDNEPEATARLNGAIAMLNQASLSVSDRMDVSIEDVEAQARQLKSEGKLDLMVLDHLGLFRMPKKDRHDLAVGHVTRRIKHIAKDLQIPVILVFQLNRGNEKGAVVRPPMPSDARDAGNIEQDLDAMLLLHRPSYYDKAARKGLRLDLSLHRNGPTGLMELSDELDMCRFGYTGRPWVDGGQRANLPDDDL